MCVLFVLGIIEYGLAALWTQAVVARKSIYVSIITFVNIMLWGYVTSFIATGSLKYLVAHASGCALGAALASRLPPEVVTETPREHLRCTGSNQIVSYGPALGSTGRLKGELRVEVDRYLVKQRTKTLVANTNEFFGASEALAA